MMIHLTGKTNLVGVIGWPVSHSVSPAMHNAAFAALGLDWCYVPLPVPVAPADRIGEAVRGLRALGLRGANVTVPHKQAVMPHLDRLSPAAEAIGAVNTIVVEPDGSLLGDNTDAPGFVADLREHGIDPAGKRVLVLGAGGSARAVVYGLAEAGCRSVAIANRTVDRAAQLAAEMEAHFPAVPIAAHALPAAIATLAAEADLIVNTTSLGMTPNVDTTPWDEGVPFHRGQVVYDLVYNPPQTRLLRKAADDGATAIGGLGMLIWQGAIAFERWTGQQPPVDKMRRAALDDLRARGVLSRPLPAATVQVRLATPADAELISSLNSDVQQLHADVLPHIFKPPTDESWPPAAVGVLMASPDHTFWVATCDDAPAGYLYAQRRTSPASSSKHEQSFLYIHHLSVKPHFQQRGCGEQLVAAAKTFAQMERLPELILDTWAFNEKAQRFFAQQGFETFNYRMRLPARS
jgi:shikimate dehydrogenase